MSAMIQVTPMRKVVVYAGTRNIYGNMATAAKSLLLNNPGVDQVYFLIEDDVFPEDLPKQIRCINVLGQTWFYADGPNYKTRWTYMTLMRLALPEILPDEHRVLWLDVDTIVVDDISQLFETDLEGCYFGAAEEPSHSQRPFVYHNAGVLLCDLDALRDGKYLELIRFVNGHKMDFADQDCINLACQKQIKVISPIYNASAWTDEPLNAKIVHFAADRNYQDRALFKHYAAMKWGE